MRGRTLRTASDAQARERINALWAWLRTALTPFGIWCDVQIRELWLAQWEQQLGPLWAACRGGNPGEVDALIRALRGVIRTLEEFGGTEAGDLVPPDPDARPRARDRRGAVGAEGRVAERPRE